MFAVRCRDCSVHEEAIGEVRWSPEEGATYRVEFPGVGVTNCAEFCRNTADGLGAGTVSNFSRDAEWTGKTMHGGEIRLFGTTKESESTHTSGTSGCTMHSTVKGHAAFVSVELPHDGELTFWHDTKESRRFSFVGFEMLRWPQCEDNTFTTGDGANRTWRQTLRCSLTLSEQPLIKIVAGGPRWQTCQLKHAWMAVDDTVPVDDWNLSADCRAASSFLSFILGVRTPFLWQDTLQNKNRLSRVYYGWQRAKTDRPFVPQPLPLGGVVEALQHGPTVVDALPRLFKTFLELHKAYDIDWIVSPLWYALDAFADDKLALACVSLERFVAAHTEYSNSDDIRQTQTVFWSKQQGEHVRQAMQTALQTAAKEVQLANDKVEILGKRISQFGQMTNADRMTAAFDVVGLRLTEAEIDAIKKRNVCLHGNRSLKDSGNLVEMNEEMGRFDTLRMVIYKAVLSLVGYEGPYIDYAERPSQGNFPIKIMRRNTG
jgi:hypothetical protein